MKLEIYDKDGIVKLTASPSASSTVTEEVMGECSLSATFTLPDFIAIDVNDYATVGGVRYSAKRAYKPQMNNTQEYTYQIKLYAPIHDAEQVVMLQLSDGSQNPEFSLTAGPREHLQKWVDNMNRLYDTPRWTIGTVIDGESRTIDYQSTKCWDAAFGGGGIAETYETELWADGYVVNLCRCERNLPVTLGYRKGLLKPRQDESTGDVRFFTRLIPLGSTRNIDPTTYGYSRLQLPSRAEAVEKNVDLYGVYEDTEEAAFSEIYPKYIGTVGVVRTEQKTDEQGKDYTVYYFTDPGMDFNPNDYELADQVKMISFQSGDLEGYGTDDDKSFQANWHEDTKEWEIINLYPDENTQIPGGNIIPRPGDTYFPWNIRMPESYTTEAERLYAEAVDDFLTNYATDTNQYSAPTDPLYCRKNEVPMMIGQAVRLESAEYFKDGFLDTRMTKVVRKLNDLYDATITCADKVGNGWKRTVDNQLSTLKYTVEKKGDTAFLNIIRLNDKTSPSDYNVFSSLKALATLLRKDQADTMPYLLTLLKGAVFGNSAASIDDKGVGRLAELFVGSKVSIDVNGLLTAVKAILQNIVLSGDLKSDNFLAGALGTGYALIKRDADGKSYLEVDKLFARVKAIFAILEILKLTYSGGNYVFSPAGMNCTKVEEYDGYYRCYFTADDGEKAVENTFEVDDLVQLREFNVKPGVYENVSNRYFWRRCIAKGDDYIDLSKTDRDMTSDDAPMTGDALVTIGNKTIASRQNVIIISVYGEGSPSIIQYEGINDYTLDGKAKTVISPNGNKFTGSFTFESGKDIEDELGDLNDKINNLDSIYRIDLTNEIAGVAATSDGTVTGTLPTTDINVYAGNKLDSGWAFAATYQGCTGSISGNTLTIKTITADDATATVTATKSGKPTLTAVMSIYKVKAGADGSDGKDAVIYSIVPSATQVIKSSTGTLTPASLTCAKYKTIGNGTATVTTEKTLKYQRLGVDSTEVAYSGAVAVTAETKSVVFSLYDGSTLLDRENVPVLSDASDLVIGTRNLAIYNTCMLGNMTKNGYELNQIKAGATSTFNLQIQVWDKNNAYKALVSKTISSTGIYSFVVSSDIIPYRIVIKANDSTLDTSVSFYNDFKSNTQYTITFELTNITQGSFSWKNVMITEGNKQVDFTPAPEDIDQQIEDTLNSSKTYTDSKIEATEEKITLEVSKVQINTRNLVKNGEFKISGSTSYLVKTVYLYVPLVVGQKYTIVSKATVRGSQKYTVYDSRGMSTQAILSKDTSTGLYTKVFTYSPREGSNNSILTIYNYPSSTAADNPMDIEWFCLYEGEVRVPRDFNPAFEDAAEYTNSKIEQTADEITSTVSKWVQGGNNLITNTYQERVFNKEEIANRYLKNDWKISPKCAGKSIVTVVKVVFTGCTFSSGAYIRFQLDNKNGWNYNYLIPVKYVSSNGEYVLTGIINAPSSLTGDGNVYALIDYITGGTITVSELRSYIADSIEPLLPWEPSEGDLVGFDSKIQQTADSISLKVQGVVTGTGTNILVNSSFSQNVNGWNNANLSDITTMGGYKCIKLSPQRFINQPVRMVNKDIGTKVAISFDIYKPSTLKVLNMRLSGDSVEDTNPIDLTGKPNNTWTRVTSVQTIKSESECEIFLFGNSYGGDYADSTGIFYIKNVKLEYGDTATAWSEASDGLLSDILATGIDILKNKIILTADKTIIQSNSGKEIAMFTTDADGKPLIKGENIDATNIRVKYLETSAERYDERNDKIIIDAESNTFKMLIKDTLGERNVFDLMFTEDSDYGTIADMLFNRYDGSTLAGRTQINQNAFLIESYLRNKVSHASKITSEYLLLENNNVDDSSGTVQDSIKLSASTGLTLTDRTTAKTYNGKTQSVYVATSSGQLYMNFYRGFFVGMSASAWFSTSN